MNILMVYPQYTDTFWSFKYALKLISKKTIYPPLGLLTVASMLPGDWNKKLIDMNLTDLRDGDILWADYVFISGMQIQKMSTREVISKCHQLNRKVVAGGPLFTHGFEEFKGVSHFVLGEAEMTLPRFLDDLKNGCAKPVYKPGEPPDLSITPLPLWSLINLKDYASMNIQYSRGCPFDCEFCEIVSLFGRKPRTKSIKQIIDELDVLYNHKWRGQVFIVDDNFIGNKKKLKDEVLPAIIEWSKSKQYPFYFLTEASIDLADDEDLMKLMIEAGFTQVFVGIESPNDASLAECNKLPNRRRDLVASVKKLQNHGFEVQGGFIIGFDNDNESVFKSQIDFIQKSGIVVAMVGLLNVPLGSKLFERLKAENRLLDEVYGDNTETSLHFIPKMDSDTLINGYKHVLDTIYSPSHYFERIKEFFSEYRPQKKGPSRVEWNYFLSLFKSVWILGFVENGRGYFWILLIFTLFRYPHFFWQSVSFYIYRRHFYRQTKRLLSA
jgi:radical SAM superfamily enzyme YgiQ (UPF0313 family)